MIHRDPAEQFTPAFYGRFLLFIAGTGGLLYGIDLGIISAALLYLSKTISLSLVQTSAIVAAVLGGSMLSALIAGFLADWLGRRTMMITSGCLFITSVGFIVLSRGFTTLFLGRLLQGISGGVIAVVVPLYLAECLSAEYRGRGTAIFQLMVTVGIVLASFIGWFYTRQAENSIAAAARNPTLILAAQNHAWRGMFLSVVYPGLIFFTGSFFLSETPRWLFRRGRTADAIASLRRSCSEEETMNRIRSMEALSISNKQSTLQGKGSLLQRKYVVPFVLACIVLACTQATGVNSILGYLVLILRDGGMNARHATQGDLAVKILNCLMTLVAVALVDRKGRKFLLIIGTGGIIVALSTGAFLFRTFEARRVDLKSELQCEVRGNKLDVPLSTIERNHGDGNQPSRLTVMYSYGAGDKISTIQSGVSNSVLKIDREVNGGEGPLIIKHAFLGPLPTQRLGWFIEASLALFIVSFALGPGVVNWLMLSELMPTRIRSAGMGIALLLNGGISTFIAGLFLPVVGAHGYSAMFAFWTACTIVYFVTAAFFLPETKGKSLEDIESFFESSRTSSGARV